MLAPPYRHPMTVSRRPRTWRSGCRLEPVSLAQLHGGERALASKALIGRRSASAREAIGKGDRVEVGGGGRRHIRGEFGDRPQQSPARPEAGRRSFRGRLQSGRAGRSRRSHAPGTPFRTVQGRSRSATCRCHVGAASAETPVSLPRWRRDGEWSREPP